MKGKSILGSWRLDGPTRFAPTARFGGRMLAALSALLLLGMVLTTSARANADGDDRDDRGPVSQDFRITTLSTKSYLVSGGNVLIRVEVPRYVGLWDARIKLNGKDVTGTFHPDGNTHALIGLVTGLNPGRNFLHASSNRHSDPRTTDDLVVTNYPITGPIISGPHLQPFICQTGSFVLPDGTFLGPALDADCSAPTKINYVYLPNSAGATFKPLPSTSALPADVSMTTTLDGVTVPFVVRVETGTMDRGIYQNAVLHDPAHEAPPSPFSPPKGWNGRLIAEHGTGCVGGWYIQGGAQGANILDPKLLGEGYAFFINTLNHPTNSCNALLAGEATMMGKEHFIETFGVPSFTVTMGCSGGSYTSLQIADAFPGLFDGVYIQCTFPDALAIAVSALDSRLLSHYYLTENAAAFTEPQIVAVSGQKSARAWYDLAEQSGRTDPVPHRADPIPPSPVLGGYASAVWNPVVPAGLRYDPVTNPTGARPTVFDVARNVYGIDRKTGFALRPFDNVGVQYGFEALNAGVITNEQFLDLNARIGGFDQDANYVPNRTVGDRGAIHRAHITGLSLSGGGGLASIPVFDTSQIFDDDQIYHYQYFHFAARARLQKENGQTRNHVMWRGGAPITDLLGITSSPSGAAINALVATKSWDTFIQWVDAYTSDHFDERSRALKVLLHKPAAAIDGCFTQSTTPQFIAEPQTLSSKPDTRCNKLWPSHSVPRKEAGGPLDGNTLKCQLKRPDFSDYRVSFTRAQWSRLATIFPSGVCDWSKRGVGEEEVRTWPSVGPSAIHLVTNGIGADD